VNRFDESAEDFYLARGFGRRIGFGRSPAVLVVDFMNGFTDPTFLLGAALDATVAAACDLVTAARTVAVPVVFVNTAYDFDDVRDAGLWRLKEEGISALRAGSKAVELDPRLDYRPEEDHLITKKFASAFFGTDLATRLRGLGVDSLLVAGCATSGCVRVTAVDGLQHGLRVMIVREAVGDRDPVAHERGLLEIDAKYADVVSLTDALDHLRAVDGVR
jgi:maleamate amidohydrolase